MIIDHIQVKKIDEKMQVRVAENENILGFILARKMFDHLI